MASHGRRPDAGPQLGWPELIGSMAQLKRRLEEVEPDVHAMCAPRLAATEEAVQQAERLLGHALDPCYRSFLLHASGWPRFFIDGWLLGTEELGRGPLWENGREKLDVFYSEGAVPRGLPARSELEPVAVAEHPEDVYAVWTTGPVTDGGHPVLWLADQEVERYKNFEEYFRAMYAHLSEALSEAFES